MSRRSRVALTGLAALFLLGSVPAQSYIVVPAIGDREEGNDIDGRLLARTAFRAQQIVRGAAIAPNSAALTAVCYRAETDNSSGSVAHLYPNLTLTLSHTSVSPDAMSTTFANNITGPTTLVAQGPFNVPAHTPRPGGVAFWMPIFTSQAYPYMPAQGNLLIDLIAQDTGATLNRSTDSALPGGTARTVGATGPTSVPDRLQLLVAGNGPSQGRFSGLVPGGSFVLFAQSTAKAYRGGLLIGIAEANPPIHLGPLGAPNNFLYVQPPVLITDTFTMAPSIGGFRATWQIPVPSSPNLVFARITAQCYVSDPSANALGLVTTNAMRITIGQALPHPMNQIDSTDPNSPTGSWTYVSGILGGAIVRLDGTFF